MTEPAPFVYVPDDTHTECNIKLSDLLEALKVAQVRIFMLEGSSDLLRVAKQAIDESGFNVSGPTDHRAAEDGEPAWVCNARAAIAAAEGEK